MNGPVCQSCGDEITPAMRAVLVQIGRPVPGVGGCGIRLESAGDWFHSTCDVAVRE